MFFISGASGSGKTSLLPLLRNLLPDIDVEEFDSVGVPPDADTAWRQRTTEAWIQKAVSREASGREMLLVGHVQYGEVLACLTASRLSSISMCLLDCADPVRIARIRARDGHSRWATMEMLSWASFQRMHAVDPQWYPDVLQKHGAAGMQWQRWSDWQQGDSRWQVSVIDTSTQTLAESAQCVAEWVRENQSERTAKNPVNA